MYLKNLERDPIKKDRTINVIIKEWTLYIRIEVFGLISFVLSFGLVYVKQYWCRKEKSEQEKCRVVWYLFGNHYCSNFGFLCSPTNSLVFFFFLFSFKLLIKQTKYESEIVSWIVICQVNWLTVGRKERKKKTHFK